jgi:tellurite resistance protein TerC
VKKLFIALIGGTVLLFGVVLLVLPGPGLPVIAVALAILATEFLWARRAFRQAKGAVAKVRRKIGLAAWFRKRRTSTSVPTSPATLPAGGAVGRAADQAGAVSV